MPAGSTQVRTAATSGSNEDQRPNTSMAETAVRPPATTLNTVLMFTTENNKNIYMFCDMTHSTKDGGAVFPTYSNGKGECVSC